MVPIETGSSYKCHCNNLTIRHFSANIFRMINSFKISLIIQKIDVILPLQSIGVVFYFLNFSTSKLNYTRYVAAAAIFQLVVIDIIIDLLLIYLTRGRNLVGKIKKNL